MTLVGTIGRTAVVPSVLAGANVARAVGVLVPVRGMTAEWLEIVLRGEGSRQRLTRLAREVARKTLNIEQVRSFGLPLPPAEEQAEIISRSGEALSRADAAEAALDSQSRAARALRQSILKAAFAGQLIPQESAMRPADRPGRRERKKAPA